MIGGLDVERDFGDDAERAEADDGAVEMISASFARESFTTSPEAVTISSAETAVARLPFFSPEPWVAVHAGAGDGNMWQRGEIVQREALGVEIRARAGRR